MIENKIKIKGKEYEVKIKLKGYVYFEALSGKPFEISNVTDSFTAAYSFFLASNPDCGISFDDFLDSSDEDPSIISTIINLMTEKIKQENQLSGKKKEVKKTQKTVKS